LLSFLAFIITDVGVVAEEFAQRPLFLGAAGRGPGEDADLSRVRVDHDVRRCHRREAEVAQRLVRGVDDLVRPFGS
jgi:hypothetical protein